MGYVSSESIKILQFLLPGFLAAGLFQTLTSSLKPSGINIIVHAFVFTFFVHLLAQPILYILEFGEFGTTCTYILLAVLFGGIAAWIWNEDILHKFCRKINISVQSSNYSTRYSAFTMNRDCYVVLHLKGERRLYGWPKGWPSRPSDQYYLIEEFSWLSDNGNEFSESNSKSEQVPNSTQILISGSEVEMVEFIPIETNS